MIDSRWFESDSGLWMRKDGRTVGIRLYEILPDMGSLVIEGSAFTVLFRALTANTWVSPQEVKGVEVRWTDGRLLVGSGDYLEARIQVGKEWPVLGTPKQGPHIGTRFSVGWVRNFYPVG